MVALRVITLNMHKGLSPLKLNTTVYRLRQKLRSHHPDLIFIQELQQENVKRHHSGATARERKTAAPLCQLAKT